MLPSLEPLRSRVVRGEAASRLPLLALAALALGLAVPASAQVVELNPVPLSGTIRVGDFVIGSMTVRATSSVGTSTFQLTPNAVEAPYSTIVQVPAGGTAFYRLSIDAVLRSPDGSQTFGYRYQKPGVAVVQDGVPATFDFVVDPVSTIDFTVTASAGELLDSVSLYARRYDGSGTDFFDTRVQAPAGGAASLQASLPVGPGIQLNCYGGANMTNGRGAALEPFQVVTVPEGGVATCDFTPEPPPVLGSVRGALDLAGDLPVDEYRVFLNSQGAGSTPPPQVLVPPFTGRGNYAEYEFTDVEQGDYVVYAQATLNGGFDQVVLQLSNRFGVSEAPVFLLNREFCEASIETSFVFGGLTDPSDLVFSDRPATLSRIGNASFGSRPLVDPRDGPFRSVVTDGSWTQGTHFSVSRAQSAPGGFTYTDVGLGFDDPIPVECGETVATPTRVIDTGRIEIHFRVADGSYLQSPLIQGTCELDDAGGAQVYSDKVTAYSATNVSVPEGIVPVEAPAGVCDFTATARVGGVTIRFGSLNDVEIQPGVEVVIGLDGPRVEIASPSSGDVVDSDSILVTGTATDDGEVVSVVVNGVEAALAPTGNPADPREVAFSATVPLTSGDNRIAAVATDDGGNETEASLHVENAAPPPDQAPSIAITSPASGDVVDTDEVLVEGTASDDRGIASVVVGGIEAELTPTGNPDDPTEVAFSVLVPLEPGENEIAAVATDDGGNESQDLVIVQLLPPPPLVCDANADGQVDRLDIADIFAARGSSASGPDDPRDVNGDGLITINDGRLCVLECTNPACAP